MACARAAVSLDGDAEQAQPAHFAHEAHIERLMPVGLRDAGEHALAGEAACGVPDQALVLGQLFIEKEWVFPGEGHNS